MRSQACRSLRSGDPLQQVRSLIATAEEHGARSVVIEDLDFAGTRAEGRERHGNRPSRGTRGRGFRRAVAGIPTPGSATGWSRWPPTPACT